jgi:hypothetical protein
MQGTEGGPRRLESDPLKGGPQTWQIPAQPGPEVTHVRDNAGRIWRQPALGYHNPDQWAGYWRTSDNQLAKAWLELLTGFGPLTDVTDSHHPSRDYAEDY